MNFQITQGSGTTIGSDPVAAVNFQQIKLMDATIGSAAGTGIAANPLKVSLEFTNTNTNPLLISGTITSDIGTTGGLALDATLLSGNVKTQILDNLGNGLTSTLVGLSQALDTNIVETVSTSDIFITGTLPGLNSTVVLPIHGMGACVAVIGGTWTGDINAQVSGDGGLTWNTVSMSIPGVTPFSMVPVNTNGTYRIPTISGFTHVRLIMIAYTSGTATVRINAAAPVSNPFVFQTIAANLKTTSWLNDGSGNSLTSTTIGAQQALDVNIAGGVSIDVNLDHTTDNVLVYGNDGTTDRKILTDVAGRTEVVVSNFPATQAVTQSGVWTTGRTWTLASGTDSVAAAQSGTWNINNISGTISLPTGAATEATLATRLADATFTARVNTLGQKTMANSTPVVLASDQTVIPVSQSGAPWSQNLTQIAGSAISTAASGIARVGLTDGTGNAITSTANALDTNIKSWLGSTVPTVGQKVMANAVPVVLASDQGFTYPTTWHLSQRVANNQVFSVCTILNMAVGNVDNPAILLRNPNGSGKTMYLRKLTFGCDVDNVSVEVRVFASPTITTNGTTFTPTNRNVGSATASVILAGTLPTVSASGTCLVSGMQAQNANAVPVIDDFEIAVPPNQNVLITANPDSNNRIVDFTVSWVEA